LRGETLELPSPTPSAVEVGTTPYYPMLFIMRFLVLSLGTGDDQHHVRFEVRQAGTSRAAIGTTTVAESEQLRHCWFLEWQLLRWSSCVCGNHGAARSYRC